MFITRGEEDLNKNMPGQTALQGQIYHWPEEKRKCYIRARVLWLFYRELRSHPYYMQELVWSLYCTNLHGQLGFAVHGLQARLSLLRIHKACDANPSATLIFHSLCHNAGLDCMMSIPSVIIMACRLHNCWALSICRVRIDQYTTTDV